MLPVAAACEMCRVLVLSFFLRHKRGKDEDESHREQRKKEEKKERRKKKREEENSSIGRSQCNVLCDARRCNGECEGELPKCEKGVCACAKCYQLLLPNVRE